MFFLFGFGDLQLVGLKRDMFVLVCHFRGSETILSTLVEFDLFHKLYQACQVYFLAGFVLQVDEGFDLVPGSPFYEVLDASLRFFLSVVLVLSERLVRSFYCVKFNQ